MAQMKISKDLIPTTQAQRKTGVLGYLNIWIGLAIILATFAVGGEVIYQANLQQVIVASIAGCLILGVVITLVGDIGMEHGIAFPTYCRAVLGQKGVTLINVIRIIFAGLWFGIQTYFGAVAINVIIRAFIGYDNWFLWFVVFAIAQVINTALGFKSIEKFADIAAPIIILVGIYMTVKLFGFAEENNIPMWSNILDSSESVGSLRAFIVVMILNMCFWADATAEYETWTRYIKVVPGEKNFIKRNKTALAGHLIGLPLAESFMVFIGAVSMIAVNNYNPIEAIQTMTESKVILAALLLMVIMAQWSTNNTANLLPGAISIVDITNSRIKYPMGVVLIGVLGGIMQPWVILDNVDIFLRILGSIWATFIGITLSDYYLIRRRRLNIPALFQEHGQFEYAKGWNFAGASAILISLVACYFFSDYSVFVGAGVSFITYSILAKFWFFKKYPQSEVSATGDEFLGTTVGREWLYDEEKNVIYPSK